MHNDQHHAEGITGGAFNARVSPNQPSPAPAGGPRREGSVEPATPGYAGHARTSDHLVPSTQPTLQIASAGLIARALDAELRLDEQKRRATVAAALNLDEGGAADPHKILAGLSKAVRDAEITNDEAAQVFTAMFPGVDPASVRGQS